MLSDLSSYFNKFNKFFFPFDIEFLSFQISFAEKAFMFLTVWNVKQVDQLNSTFKF